MKLRVYSYVYIERTMDPKFAEAIRRSRLEGEEMRKREYLESCDRGAKEIKSSSITNIIRRSIEICSLGIQEILHCLRQCYI